MRTFYFILLAACCRFVSIAKSQYCLGDKEKERFTSIKSSMVQLNTQILGLKTSLKEKRGNACCPNGWIPYRDHCYYFSSDSRNWYESERFCREHDSTLAKIENYKENAWILARAPKARTALWVGASDMKEDQWLWSVDFTSFTFVNWYRGNEPNGGKSENCLSLYGEMYNGTWNDLNCDSKIQFLCKKKMPCSCE